MPPTTIRLAALATIILIWGSTWAAIRLGLEGIPPFAGVALRFAVASVVLLGLAWARGVPLGRSRVERRLWWVNGLCTFVLTYGLVYWAEQRVPSGLTSVLFATFPLFVALLAQGALPAERLTARSAAGVVVGFAGVAVIFSEDLAALAEPGAGRAAAVLLVAPLAAAVANVAVKRWGRGVHPLSLTAVPMGLAAGIMGAASLLFERDRPLVLDALSVGTVLYLAVLGSAVTFYLYFWLLERMEATRLSLVTYLSPVVAVALGAVLFDERITARIALGGLLVIAGVAVTAGARHGLRAKGDRGLPT
ncbi:MAG TPA: EamA family transporter [Thermoanaerobaculia bacterium]|nr:EamA family transporter [Thermoanaerobaculia bacterium]